MDAKQVELNRRNIDALVDTMKAQGKLITGQGKQLRTQSLALTTMGNELTAMRKSMAQATAMLGTGPTAR